jgi:hypothetical protein
MHFSLPKDLQGSEEWWKNNKLKLGGINFPLEIAFTITASPGAVICLITLSI